MPRHILNGNLDSSSGVVSSSNHMTSCICCPRPANNFFGLLGSLALLGLILYSTDNVIIMIVFAATAWLIALCVHEFSHAIVAYHGGDHRYMQY